MAKLSKNKLSTMIRTIVREEVAMAIQEVITELKQPTSETKTLNTGAPVKAPVVEKKYSDNPVLNDILNETANDGSMDEWKSMGGETYDSSKMNDVLQSSYGNETAKLSGDQMVASLGKNPEAVPDQIKDALTKDYSGLLKAMDKKSKVSRGG